MSRSLCVLLAALPLLSASAAPPAANPKEKMKVPMFDLPAFKEIPKAEGLVAPKAEKLDATPVPASQASYEILKIQHGRAFTRSPSGGTAVGGELTVIALAGTPPSTEKFSTLVRARCPQRVNAPIDLMLLDGRGTTVMSARGTVVFPGGKQPEVDYQVDWDPTPLRSGGDYKLLVRLANQPMGTWPLRIGVP